MTQTSHASLTHDGYSICSSVLSQDEIERYRTILSAFVSSQGSPGRRDLLRQIPEIGKLSRSSFLLELVDEAIGGGGFPVRAIFFDKIEKANWPVLWHQDLSIAVRRREELDGYGPWSVKADIPHVQPPSSVLESMVTLRVHLDDADEENGALLVIPGSHKLGRIPEKDIPDRVARGRTDICRVKAGDVMLMRPLLLHSSRRSHNPTHRRVIHIEYANYNLPSPLEWYERN